MKGESKTFFFDQVLTDVKKDLVLLSHQKKETWKEIQNLNKEKIQIFVESVPSAEGDIKNHKKYVYETHPALIRELEQEKRDVKVKFPSFQKRASM